MEKSKKFIYVSFDVLFQYNRPFHDDDEIDLSNFEVVSDNGKWGTQLAKQWSNLFVSLLIIDGFTCVDNINDSNNSPYIFC